MYINVIWILLTIGVSFLLTGNILYACETGVIFLVVWGMFHALRDYLKIRKLKQFGKLRFTKKYIEHGIVLFLLAVVGLSLFFSHYPYFQEKIAMHRMMMAYDSLSEQTIKEAEANLKAHPNNMHYCALLTMPSLDDNDPKALAAYLAYYRLSTTYCDQYWDWGRQDCGYLKHLKYRGYSMELVKNIKLCEIAKDISASTSPTKRNPSE